MEIQTIEIESIKFAESIQKGVVQSYAKSGFYLVSSEDNVLEDFVIVDIESHLVHFICSLETFDMIKIVTKSLKENPPLSPMPSKFNANVDTGNEPNHAFILEFARILIGSKK